MRTLPGLLLALVPALSWAQGDVRGELHDSLRADGPLAGALIVLEGTALSTRTDGRGRFLFLEVPPGRYAVRFVAPWLDSLSLPPVRARVVVRDLRTTQARLATPSMAAYHRTHCGVAFTQAQGVLRGEVRDRDGAPLAGIPVGASWSVESLEGVEVRSTIAVSLDTTDATGMFTLCGLPRRAPFFMQAGADDVRTGDLTFSLGGSPGARQDLVVGDRAREERGARLTGRVTTMRGSALRTAVVAVPGDSLLGVHVDVDGRFAVDGVPRRTTQFAVRAVGFAPRLVTLDVGADEIELPDISLDPVMLVSASLAAVKRAVDSLAFRERERLGAGVFVDDAAIARGGLITADTLALYPGGVRSTGGPWPRIQLLRGRARCYPRFFIDEVDFGIMIDGQEEVALLRAATRFEVHTAASMPQPYIDLGRCGVVLIWTQ